MADQEWGKGRWRLNKGRRVQGGAEEVPTLPQGAGSGWTQEMGSLPPEACKEEEGPPSIQRVIFLQ